MVCTGFGAYSLYWWSAATRSNKEAWFYMIAAVAAALLVWSIVQLRAMRHAPRSTLSRQSVISYNVRFFAIVATEVAGIILGYPNWVDGMVGIHFLPLGRLFKMPIYYATSGAISLAAFGSLLISETSSRVGICAGGTGLALWLTGGLILYKNLSNLPPKKTQPDVLGKNSV